MVNDSLSMTFYRDSLLTLMALGRCPGLLCYAPSGHSYKCDSFYVFGTKRSFYQLLDSLERVRVTVLIIPGWRRTLSSLMNFFGIDLRKDMYRRCQVCIPTSASGGQQSVSCFVIKSTAPLAGLQNNNRLKPGLRTPNLMALGHRPGKE